MYRNVNLDAHLGALLFLGSAALLVLLLAATVILFFWNRHWLRHAITILVTLAITYAVLLLGFSLISREHTLAHGEEKYFCELDCHLAYSVQGVERAKTIGNATADGEFYIVTVRTRFDETTTAPWRPRDVSLTPNRLDFVVVDKRHAIRPSFPGQTAWDALQGASNSLLDPLQPGQSYETTLIFDVPPDASAPRLLAAFAVFPTQLLIGDESSVLHKKTYFAL